MSESIRTLSFVGVAVASVAVAWIVHASSQPEEPEAFAKVGAEFYPDFTDPTAAGSLKIADYDEKSAKVHEFTVEFKNGRWRIPSHHGYPADAKDRLEKAAASLIGVTRKSLAGRRANSHERFGVSGSARQRRLQRRRPRPADHHQRQKRQRAGRLHSGQARRRPEQSILRAKARRG